MAPAASGIRQELKSVGGYGISAHPSEVNLEKDSSTFKKGTPLLRDAGTGTVVTATSPLGSGIIGIAEEDGKNGTAVSLRYNPAYPGAIFEGQLDDDSLDHTYALLQTDLYSLRGVKLEVASGRWYLSTDGKATARAVIVNFKSKVGDKDPIVRFVFLIASTIYG